MIDGLSLLILRSRASGVSKDEADIDASWFETAHSRLLTMRVLTLRDYRPVFTLVQRRLMMRCVAGSRAVITKSFASIASSG